jgi:hypothetical protein
MPYYYGPIRRSKRSSAIVARTIVMTDMLMLALAAMQSGA